MSTNEPKYEPGPRLMIKPWIIGIVVFVLIGVLCYYVVSQRYRIQQHEEKQAALNMAESVGSRLQQTLQYSLSATQALTLIIDRENMPSHFDSVAAYILRSNKYIDVLQLIPDGIVRYTHPLQGNEAAIGHNILTDSTRKIEALKAIEKKEFFFAGPLHLRQGGLGVIGRLPVFRNNQFWGFSAVIIYLQTLYEATGIDTTGRNGYHFQLSRINPYTNKEEIFLPIPATNHSRHYEVPVKVPNGEWKLAVIPVNGSNSFQSILPLGSLGLVLSLITALFAYYLAKSPARSEKRMKESELKYRTLVEQANDFIFIANFKGEFLMVNPAGCKMSQYTEEEFKNLRFYDLAVSSETLAMPFKFDEIKAGKTTTSERKMIRKDGQIVDVEVSAKIIAPDRFLALARDITERKKVENELRRSQEDLRQLTNYIENIREEERLYISREIHDELGQQLTVLKMDVSRLNKQLVDTENKYKEESTRILSTINKMVDTVRKISSELRPGMLDDIGLVAALDWYCHDFAKKFGVKTNFNADIPDDAFSKKLNISLFRIFQDSMTNIARHADATRVDVSLAFRDQQLILLIEDNGKGFDPATIETSKNMGIMGMQERAIMIGGMYKIDSLPGRGTIIEVTVSTDASGAINMASGHL